MAEECAEVLGCDDELSKLGYTNTTTKKHGTAGFDRIFPNPFFIFALYRCLSMAFLSKPSPTFP
jgi:hypothetical protein